MIADAGLNHVVAGAGPGGNGHVRAEVRALARLDLVNGATLSDHLAADFERPLEVELVLCAQPGFAHHLVRERVLAELRPGSVSDPCARNAPRQAASASHAAPETTCGGKPRIGRPLPSIKPVCRASASPSRATLTT